MKIAVMSDIHGNKLALDAVLEDIFTNKCNEIWCLGDIAMAGYDPNYTIEKIKFLMSDESPVKTMCICGNTDQMVVNYSEDLFERMLKVAPPMAYALQDNIKVLEPENIEFLKTLPPNERITIDGIVFFLCHGSPRKIDENIYPNVTLDVLDEMIEPAQADVTLCGHTHVPCGLQLLTGQSVVNVGSVGRPMNEDKSAVWVMIDTFETGEYEIIHKFVKYDSKTAAEKMKERGYPECEKLASMLLEKV